ncbi:hypothetical protein OC70_00045 [Micrococcus luteus]|uniref:hypothetical protein n=1 Tax=Micrococcaceae TaxID=1268 RepID=UPI000596B52B|nr:MULTISPECIES: hypothetical protein [Micrococcaceae]KIK90386.1 hypothetical protein OC70_00045 [Micrococcus luteus]MBO1029134.1 hypothetical protein [Micrococcus luteus]MCV7463363.1 hypothetical protein [Micrococcus luteus]MCV7466307.1 hypothetical protein [Micrococcus luteus]MCV7507879.1 hypothetical protein [Micrococcus luteus]
MSDFVKDMASGVAGDLLLWLGGLIGLAALGLLLRFRPVRRIRNWGSRTFNIPRIDSELRYGISLDNWIPQTDLTEDPPSRDTLVWALERGGGPYTSTGSSYHRITLTAASPVNFEVREVTVSYARETHQRGITYCAVRDGLGGSGTIEPAYFRVHVGVGARHENHDIRAERISAPAWADDSSTVAEPYRITDATQLHIDLYLQALTEGLYTYTVKTTVAVNGIERVFVFGRAEYGNRGHPLRSAYFLNPAQMHEEFVDPPRLTHWLPGPPKE